MDVASSDYLKTALYAGDSGPDAGNRDSLRLMELGLHLETLHEESHRLNTSVDHLLNDPTLSGTCQTKSVPVPDVEAREGRGVFAAAAAVIARRRV